MTSVPARWLRAAASAALMALLPATATAGEVRYDGNGHAYHPMWSLDGKYIAFEVNPFAGDIDLFFVELKGDVAQQAKKVSLPGGGSGFGSSGQVVVNPSWHPQGIAVFEGSNQGGEFRLYFAQPGGASAAEMLPTSLAPGNLTFPAISPDGNMLGYVSAQTGNGDIRSWNRSTNKVDQLTSTSSSEMFPLYHKDGKRILFTRKQDNTEDIFELQVGGAEKPLAGGAGDQTRPVYAAGDRILYFTSERGTDNWDLGVLENGSKKILSEGIRLPLRARPAVSPDGQWVAYGFDDPTKNTYIELKKVDGSKTVQIKTNFTACGEPAITVQNGRTLLAFTALPSSDSDWRFLYVQDITDQL